LDWRSLIWWRLKQLETLSLDFNYLREIPTSIGRLKGLKTLLLANNELKQVPTELTRLKTLSLLDWRIIN
jgi:Leucine-rich repeat (LRR) protein